MTADLTPGLAPEALSWAIESATEAHAVIQYRTPAAIAQLTDHDYKAMRAFVTPLVTAAVAAFLAQYPLRGEVMRLLGEFDSPVIRREITLPYIEAPAAGCPVNPAEVWVYVVVLVVLGAYGLWARWAK